MTGHTYKPVANSSRGVLSVTPNVGETDDQAVARYATMPEVGAAMSLMNLVRDCRAAPLDSLVEAVKAQSAAVNGNDLSRVESMLSAQAHTLDALFNNLLHRAMKNVGEYFDAADRYFRLAMRAQNQCRATLETLATVKNPPNVAFVRQANIGQAVQVNNGEARARDGFRSNELLEGAHERLEHSTAAAAVTGNPKVATLGPINGTKNRGRKSTIKPEQPEARRAIA